MLGRKMIVKKTGQNRNRRQPHNKEELPVSMELVGSLALHELPVLCSVAL